MSEDLYKAYSLGKRLSRTHFMEKNANPFRFLKRMVTRDPNKWRSTDEPAPAEPKNLSKKRTVERGVAMPSPQERYDSARDIGTDSLEQYAKLNPIQRRIMHNEEQRKTLEDEIVRRRHGGTGSFSQDYGTVQRDVDRLQQRVRDSYTPKLPADKVISDFGGGYKTDLGEEFYRKQDIPSSQYPNFMSDRTPRVMQTGDLSEGFTLGRRPANVIRPKRLQRFGDEHFEPTYDNYTGHHHDIHTFGPRYVPSSASMMMRPEIAQHIPDSQFRKDIYEEGQHVNPSSYLIEASVDPRDKSLGYTNPIIAAHEYGHGEYGLDEVEADALVPATLDYDMYDVADIYNRLTDYGARDEMGDLTLEDHEAMGDTHLPLSERLSLFADNVSNLGQTSVDTPKQVRHLDHSK